MSTKLQRLSLTLTPDIEKDINVLKKEVFYNESKSELLRQAILLGLKTLKENNISTSETLKNNTA